MKLPDLDLLLNYSNERVIRAYRQNCPNNKLPAEQALREILKYLWLVCRHRHDLLDNPDNERLHFRCVMLFSMREIDAMWHEFILHTRDYMDFCQEYFGEYLHHQPDVFINAPIGPEETQDELAKMLPYIYEQLGEQTLRTWFAEYLPDSA